MALQTSGQISLDDIHVEAGGTTLTEVSLNDSDVRDLINKAAGSQNAISEYYGASAETVISTSITQITASNYISSGGTLRVSSGVYVYSTSTSTPALTIDVPCTVIVEGYVIGKGGRGGNRNQSGLSGGAAVNVTSSGVTIQVASGAFIAGGGGGGGGRNGAGAGGAGGGNGGVGLTGRSAGTGGAIGQSGTNAQSPENGLGGGAGGSGGTAPSTGGSGGGGGRILPGVGALGARGGGNTSGQGGSAGNAGYAGAGTQEGGGGAGWGATGGASGGYSGGSGGAAITGSSRTLSNSGTIYGST